MYISMYMHHAGLTMTEDGQCSDHVIVGTKAGDCLSLDAEHDGQVMLCFPAHRSAHSLVKEHLTIIAIINTNKSWVKTAYML